MNTKVNVSKGRYGSRVIEVPRITSVDQVKDVIMGELQNKYNKAAIYLNVVEESVPVILQFIRTLGFKFYREISHHEY
eukprot:TRINITY_DN4637_c0_g1_i2.p1 TRINITY_DN4637_c0_g1~~TRINITY_DN4637_c0_g1_i2.p1  ORF type:complete len:78 (-),score=9.65 TRINITY_DN4637_c0_g1_i2:32-265(-)